MICFEQPLKLIDSKLPPNKNVLLWESNVAQIKDVEDSCACFEQQLKLIDSKLTQTKKVPAGNHAVVADILIWVVIKTKVNHAMK